MTAQDKQELAAAVRGAVARHGLARAGAFSDGGFRVTAHRVADEHAAEVTRLEGEALAMVARKHLRRAA